MLYVTCPTCKRLLGHLQIQYETEVEKIMNNPKLSDEQRENKKEEFAKKLVDRYCCRMRIITYTDFSKLLN
jgi:DNA-directed RNA polymerase subunit N (RpoN/RPB10)